MYIRTNGAHDVLMETALALCLVGAAAPPTADANANASARATSLVAHHLASESACASCAAHRLKLLIPEATCRYGFCGDGSKEFCWCYNELQGPPQYGPCPASYTMCPAENATATADALYALQPG